MKITAEMLDRINAVTEELFYDYEVIGVRFQEVPFELGPIDHISHVLIHGEDTDEELNGICAVLCGQIETAIETAQEYYGDHIAIIAGNRYSIGEDLGEIIIEDPVVVDILA